MTVVNPTRSNMKGISIQFKMSEIILKIWFWNFLFDSITINYLNGGQGPTIVKVIGKTLEISMNCDNNIKVFTQYLNSVLEDFDQILDYFHIEFASFYANLESILRNGTKLKVNYLHILSAGIEDLKSILPYFEPKNLERATLEFKNERIQFGELFESDLWMTAKQSQWSFTIPSLTFGNLQMMKKTFSFPSTPRNVNIKYEFVDVTALDELFGSVFKNENGEYIRVINVPGTKGTVLETKVMDNSISFYLDETEELQLASLDISKSNILKVFENCLILENVLQYLGCFDIQRLRKVSPNIRNCVDTVKPNARIHKMSIIVDDIDALRMDIFIEKYDSTTIFYGKTDGGDGCFVNRRLFDSDYEFKFLEDLELILRFQKTKMDELFLSFPFYSYLKDMQSGGYRREFVDYGRLERITGELLRRWKECLRSRPQLLQIKKLRMEVFNQNQLLEILPFVDPNSLKTIEIGYPYGVSPEIRYLEIDRISNLDQWRMTDELAISDRTVVSTKVGEMNLFHFSRVGVTVETISSDDLVFVRNELLKRPDFQKFKISFKRAADHFGLMGLPYSKARNIITWYYRYPSRDQALCLMYYVSRAVVFSRIHISAVPENAFFDIT